jgi:aminopeptidase N
LDVYNIVATDDFNMGAMENKSLNIFNSKYVLARPDTATDMDYLKIEAVVAHEYFHNWTGNRITCRDWFQLSLKEGLTVFRDQSFTSEHNSPVVKRIQDVRVLRNSQFTEDAGPMAHPVRPDHYIEINNFYTLTVYEKGAEVVRMQHTLLGPELFRKATDLYFERHDGQAVTVEDFVACMAQLSGRDMSQFMNWYNQKGTPQLNATWTHDEGSNTLTLTLEQSAPSSYKESEKAAWQPHHIPVAVGMVCGETGAELLPEGTRVLELRELCQSFAFPAIMAAGTIPSVLREFSAPVILKTQHSMEQTLFLMAHDADSFNRWEAGQQVAQTLLTQWIGQFQDAPYGTKVQDVVTFDEAWLKAVAQLLEKAMDDPELTREALILPTEQRLGDTMEVVDVEAIHTVREFAVCAIARRFENEMAQLHTQLDPSQTTHRGLRNLLLGLLARLQKPDHIQLATQQQAQAKNMSDELGALRALERLDIPERQTALDRFYEKWKGQRLVIDKWFALQSESQLPGAIDRVEALIEHSDFEITNPNRARSVVGAFAMGNTRHFHDAGGRGYKFLADMVLRLDAINPQVASRMVKAFNPWKRYDQGRQALIRAQLERLKASPTISKDVFEVVSRNLES